MILALRSFDGGVQIFVCTPAYDELILCLLMIYTYMVLSLPVQRCVSSYNKDMVDITSEP